MGSLRKEFQNSVCVVQITSSWPDSVRPQKQQRISVALQCKQFCLQMILFPGRKNAVPQYHLVFHGKVPYAEATFARNRFHVYYQEIRQTTACWPKSLNMLTSSKPHSSLFHQVLSGWDNCF